MPPGFMASLLWLPLSLLILLCIFRVIESLKAAFVVLLQERHDKCGSQDHEAYLLSHLLPIHPPQFRFIQK